MERYGKKLIQTWLPPHGRTITRPSCPPSWRRCLSIGDFARERAEMAPLTSRWPAIRRSAMSASLIGHLRSSTFRLSTTAVSMSLTGSRFSSESAPRPLYGAFLVKKFKQGSPSFFFVSFFVRFESLFLRPYRGFAHAGARRSCQGWPLYQPCGILQPC